MRRARRAASSGASLEDAREVMRRCDVLAGISSMEGGIERIYLSPEHAAANAQASEWIEAAGMRAWQDAAGNVRGSYPGATDDAPVLLLGSHLDTVPDAGRYDGILGVMIAIAVVRRLAAHGARLPFAIEVLGFADEEGVRYGRTLLGSCAVAGTWDPAWLDLEDADGVTMRDALTAFGLDPDAVGEAALDPATVVGYLEAHIEQGPLLFDAGRPLGVVSGIMGAKRFDLVMEGEAGHAGGVPMRHRRDALLGAAETALAVEKVALARDVVGTVGELTVAPGAANVIPGRAEFSLDVRAATDADRDKAWEDIRAKALAAAGERRLTFTERLRHEARATSTERRLSEAIEHGVRAATGERDPMELLSKAGHDAMAIASLTSYAMLFVRNGNGGVSHHPDEVVTVEDVALAIDAMEAAVLAVAQRMTDGSPL
ncbi:allantoate amidohydrolase [Demequina mangrovi]|uniref:Allantoate deiminase n=1 Tax=Demequina mangrovi TaxID=1043493 RepID=A0A1H6XBC9_9MICO|nr:allantoate amidohydrolase [Demequina mangrovi]SEJ23897.1 allantoate deiminase [Demequina mangrovi]